MTRWRGGRLRIYVPDRLVGRARSRWRRTNRAQRCSRATGLSRWGSESASSSTSSAISPRRPSAGTENERAGTSGPRVNGTPSGRNVAVKIDDYLYLVGGGDYGFNLSSRLDCNSYVLDTGDGLWMIDAGFDGADQVVANMRRDGLDPRDVRSLFVTHYHADHAGALAEIRPLLAPDLTIAIADDAAEAIRTADEEVIGLRWAKSFGFY